MVKTNNFINATVNVMRLFNAFHLLGIIRAENALRAVKFFIKMYCVHRCLSQLPSKLIHFSNISHFEASLFLLLQ